MEYFPSPGHLRHASHPLDKDHTSGRKRESLQPFRPPSTRIPAGPAQDFGQDTNNQPQKRRKKGPEKAEERPGEAQTGRTSRTPQGPKERPEEATQGHQKPTAKPAAAAGANQQPRNRKKGPERPTGGHRQGQPCRTTAPPQRPRKGPRKAREKATTRGPTPCRLWLPCRVESCRTVILDKPGVCVVYWL